ncbi:MAG: epimerase, partial [Proteobacteria bacterium]|nr:epimerase [Pseudomonadota bacterium]
LFGGRDVLINNIAWLLRRLPIFGVFGDGRYRLQPIAVEDLASLAIEHGCHRENLTIDAVGPEIFEFEELVRLIGRQIGHPTRTVHLPKSLLMLVARILGRLVGDVVLTADEVDGLAADLLVSKEAPTGMTRFSDWLADHASELGRKYACELSRHYHVGT